MHACWRSAASPPRPERANARASANSGGAWRPPAGSATRGVQESGDRPEIDRAIEIGLPDPAREQERQRARVHLLVVEHVSDERFAKIGRASCRERVCQYV